MGKFDNLSQSYGTCQCAKNGFWPLVPLLFGVSHDETLHKGSK